MPLQSTAVKFITIQLTSATKPTIFFNLKIVVTAVFKETMIADLKCGATSKQGNKLPLPHYNILGGCPFHGRVERDEIPTRESPPKQSGTLPCPALPSPPLPSPPLHSTPVPSTPLLSPPLHSLPSACLLSIVHLNAHLL